MPRGVSKSTSASSAMSTPSLSLLASPPPPTRTVSARSAKVKANASILEHDTDIDALIRKHDRKGGLGFKKTGKSATTKAKTPKKKATTKSKSTTQARTASKMPTAAKVNEDDESDEEEYDSDAKKPARKAAKTGGKTGKPVAEEEYSSDEEEVASSDVPLALKALAKAKTMRAPATKKTIAKHNDDVVNDESEVQKPAKRRASNKTILGESKRKTNRAPRSNRAEDDKAPVKEAVASSSSVASPPKVRILHTSSSTRKKNPHSTPVRSKPAPAEKRSKTMPEHQISSFLENYDLEAENRIRMAYKTLQISIDSVRTQMAAKAIAKLPRTVRLMRMADFTNEYGADVQAAVERAAVVADRARQGAWEEEKLQRKRKDDGETDDGKDGETRDTAKGKTARLDAAGPSVGATLAAAQAKRNLKGKNTARPAPNGKDRPLSRFIVPPSPVRASAQQSTVRPPSSATFRPQLAVGTVIAGRSSSVPALPPTPAGGQGRAARAGEQVQWMSMNGSPIIGVVGPDGAIHSMPRTLRRSPTQLSKERAKQTNGGGNWQTMDEDELDEDAEDAAETSAHLLDLAKGISAFRRSRNSNGRATESKRTRSTSVNASPASQMSLHTAQASRRATLEGFESDDGGSVFEEARSHPDDDFDSDDGSLPDEEAYMAQVMREEAEKRARMLASEPRMARSSASSRTNGARSSGAASAGSNAGGATNNGGSRASHSTIRAVSRKGGESSSLLSVSNKHRSSSSNVPSSPMVRSNSSGSKGAAKKSSRVASSSSALPPSSSPSKGRVSVVFGTGASQRVTQLGLEDLMRLPSHERAQMLEMLEKLKRAQLSSDDA